MVGETTSPANVEVCSRSLTARPHRGSGFSLAVSRRRSYKWDICGSKLRHMLGQTDDTADMVAQMRQLAAQDPEAAQRLAADLMAALARAGALTADAAPAADAALTADAAGAEGAPGA